MDSKHPDASSAPNASQSPPPYQPSTSGADHYSQQLSQQPPQAAYHSQQQPEHFQAQGQQSYPQGQQSYPQGQQSYPQGQQSYPQGQQSYPQGQQSYPQGQQKYPQSQQQYPQSQQQYPPGQQQYPQQNGYMMQQQHPQGMEMVQAGAVPISALQQTAAPVDCPSCHQRAVTIPSFESGGFTNLVALIVCCTTCLGCIPYLIDGLKDVTHKCGKCGVPLATWHRSGRTVVHIHPM